MKGFIPKAYKKEAVTVRFDSSTLQQLEEVSSRYGISRNELVVQCVQYALRDLQDGGLLFQTIDN